MAGESLHRDGKEQLLRGVRYCVSDSHSQYRDFPHRVQDNISITQ
ncbi:hypothetical protein [Azospirillum doebereinerae]